MLLLVSLTVLFLFIFSFSLWEYYLLRQLAPYYYEHGPLVKAVDLVANKPKHEIIESLCQDNRLVVRKINEDMVLVNFKAPRYITFVGLNTQRTLLHFTEVSSQLRVRCEVRPFYSAYLLGGVIAIFTIAIVVSENTQSEILETVIVSLMGLGMGFAVCNYFHPFASTSYCEDKIRR
jgi:hypothetical protein